MINYEDKIDELESSFPALSGSAFDAARKQALASGQDVVQSENGHLYKVSPDNKKVSIKNIDPPTRMVSGTKIEIK